MEEVNSKIHAVETVLRSFSKYDDEGQRRQFLRTQFELNQFLEIYFTYSPEALQKEKNLLQEKELKLMPPPAGNSC
jgi:hypothetical protein